MNLRPIWYSWLLVVTGCASAPGQTRIEQPITVSPSAAKPLRTELNLQRLIALVNEIFPNRDHAASFGYNVLWIDFRHFGISTVEEAREVILKNRAFAEAEEAKWQTLYGKSLSRKEGQGTPEKARRYNYNCVGMARHALRKHVGEVAFDEYELNGRPNQPVQPTPGSVTPRATKGNSK